MTSRSLTSARPDVSPPLSSQSMQPRVAVVIPAFQAADVLDATLASVVAQRVAAQEIVVVDDGSTDGTAQVARRWEAVAPLHVITQPNGGPAAARRAGVAATTSELLAFVDADDVWLPDHLAVALEVYATHGGLVSPDALSWRPGVALSRSTRRGRFPVPPPPDQRVAILAENFVFSSTLVGRSDYEAAGGFRDGVTGAEDWDLWIRLIRHGVAVHGTPGPTWLYRVGDGGLTGRPDMLATYQEVLYWALLEDLEPAERDAAQTHLAWLRARVQLAAAHDAARDHRRSDARRLARHALAGRSRLTVEALSVLAAPALATRFGDRARARWAPARR